MIFSVTGWDRSLCKQEVKAFRDGLHGNAALKQHYMQLSHVKKTSDAHGANRSAPVYGIDWSADISALKLHLDVDYGRLCLLTLNHSSTAVAWPYCNRLCWDGQLMAWKGHIACWHWFIQGHKSTLVATLDQLGKPLSGNLSPHFHSDRIADAFPSWIRCGLALCWQNFITELHCFEGLHSDSSMIWRVKNESGTCTLKTHVYTLQTVQCIFYSIQIFALEVNGESHNSTSWYWKKWTPCEQNLKPRCI